MKKPSKGTTRTPQQRSATHLDTPLSRYHAESEFDPPAVEPHRVEEEKTIEEMEQKLDEKKTDLKKKKEDFKINSERNLISKNKY